MIKKTFLISFSFLVVFLNVSYLDAKNTNEIYKKIDLFGEVLETIKEEYVDEVDQADAMDSAINGLLQSLDPYSAYMSPKSYKGMQTDTKGEFGGIGAEVKMTKGVLKVVSVYPKGSAYKAGVCRCQL